ncbi:ABC transporter ATP-binding protein [Erythrobacter sp. SCSIO 43205]|uniref:ABC transporter ATP-binding protein n=1 Tax=Erythrobacter sp. SCSIO 43205 TaxID=2779361 RepID=UPI001CA7E6EA|nr:ABC transporter ATP-binding protein [Erythrobacter sp. SCSIO 43205]UAB77992.1 ABC transporter ATP-binding protein [Erythrobacter sp. SCSIO 43205]
MSLEFQHIAHAYTGRTGRVEALSDIAFTAPTGKITCLLGSSGSGKSTLLNLAAGLLPVQSGSIRVGGEEIASANRNPPPEARPVGLVFQDGALFPHMTIAKNIAFGLSGGGSNAVIEQWLERVGLTGLGPRFPHELSGGQQQRAALARAMAPEPQVLLMDEPFASVDIVLRRRLRRDCRRLLREAGTTTILVTHDPEEALDIADHIAVMEGGRIVQFGTPEDLHDRPQTPSVGAIFGGAQVVAATREGESLRTSLGAWPLSCVAGDVPDRGELELLVHAEFLDCIEDASGLEVVDVHPLGVASRLVLQTASGEEITVQTTSEVKEGASYRVVPRDASVRAFAKG